MESIAQLFAVTFYRSNQYNKHILLMKQIVSFLKDHKLQCFFLLLLPIVFIIQYKLFIPHLSAFGCFDDCFNIMGGYFILKGKTLYSQVFFNHQMLMAYISYGVQLTKHARNIYELILNHRQFLILFSFIASTVLVVRFKLIAFIFIILYEFSKFYLFGNRFLAEALIVYPLVYLLGITWEKFHKKQNNFYDYIIAAICTWFIIFMREPFVPLSLLLYFVFMKGKINTYKRISIALFSLLTIVTLAITPLQDFYFNLVTVNQQTVLMSETVTSPLLRISEIFFYPFFVFFGGEWNIFRYLLIILSTAFIILIGYLSIIKRQQKVVIFIFITLGLANIRTVTPGTIFYAAFHMLPWYALFIFNILLMIKEVYVSHKLYARIIMILLSICLGSVLLLPQSYIYEKAYPHEQFITEYGQQLQAGEGIRALSNNKDNLFVDGFDDLIYWQADMVSEYRYTWYTSVMPLIPKYSNARLAMFKANPPDFYYGSCPKETTPSRLLPSFINKQYIQVKEHNKLSCLFIYDKKIQTITDAQWKKAGDFGYEKPSTR
jgi:hypothetical protein